MIAILAAIALAAAPAVTTNGDLIEVRVKVSGLQPEAARAAIQDAARQACAAAVDPALFFDCTSRSAARGLRQYETRSAAARIVTVAERQ